MIFGSFRRIRPGMAIFSGARGAGAPRLLVIGVLGELTERLQMTVSKKLRHGREHVQAPSFAALRGSVRGLSVPSR